MEAKRFRVAFSFAGEKRKFVAKAASILAKRFGEEAILYDKFHEAEFARYDLGIYLPKLYGEQSELIVPVLCPEYDKKRWTGWEWLHIYSLLTQTDGRRVMPCRFEHAVADGLTAAAGFVELDDKTPEDLATLVLERLAVNEGRPKDFHTRPDRFEADPVSTPIPHNLPTLQPFFGREDELERIADALDPDNRTWGALIDGPGGMGKTSLAVRAAYDASPEHFDRIIFLSLKTRELDDDGVRDLGAFVLSGLNELLNELARELDRADIARLPEKERQSELLRALRGHRILLVLDNLETLTKTERDSLITLVKRLPAGCKAILTSRGRIGSAAEEVILERLGEQAALEALADLAERNPHIAKTTEAERRQLYRETGGKPLLLRWTVGQIGRGSCLTLADAIEHLRSCPKGNDPLEFIFGDLVQQFSDAESRVIGALTLFTLPAKAEHLARLAQLPEDEAEEAVRSLAVRSLAVPDVEYRTYTLVPMVAEFLRTAKPDVVADVGLRLEDRALALVEEYGYEEIELFPQIDADWPLVAAALPRFLDASTETLERVCGALTSFLDHTGRWDEWLGLERRAEAKAIDAEDHDSAGWHAHRQGYIAGLRGESEKVQECADRAETHWQQAGEGPRDLISVLYLRGIGYRIAEDFTSAMTAELQALELARTLGAKGSKFEVSVLNSLALTKRASGDLDGADRNYQEVQRIAQSIDNETAMATCIGNRAEVAADREDWPGVETLAREALTLAESLGRKQLIAANNLRIARALHGQNRTAKALPHARLSVEIYESLRSRDLDEARQVLAECEAPAKPGPST